MKTILILASNPRRDLKLDREIRDLKKAVERSIQQNQFAVEIELAVRPQDLQDLFLYHKPCIVHFCGHGIGEPGLVFEDEAGREKIVGTEAIVNLFQLFAEGMDCALLNACYSEIQAEVIVQHVNYVIGMRQGILDSAAHFFAIGFYRGLGYGESIERSLLRTPPAISYSWLSLPYLKATPISIFSARSPSRFGYLQKAWTICCVEAD